MTPVTETPEVKQAREEHERLWKEAAKLNGIDPDLNDEYSPNAERLEDNSYDDDDQEPEGQVSNQHQSLSRYPVLPYSNHIKPDNARSFGKIDDDSVVIDAANINNLRSRFARKQDNFDEDDEVPSEPRGFFYKFDYPVPVIVDRNARLQSSEAQASENIETSIDINSEAEDEHTTSLQRRTRLGRIIPEEVPDNESIHEQESLQVKPLERKVKIVKPSDILLSPKQEKPIDTLLSPKEEKPSVKKLSPKQEKSSDTLLSHKQEKPAHKTSAKSNPSRSRGSIKFNSKTT